MQARVNMSYNREKNRLNVGLRKKEEAPGGVANIQWTYG